MDPIAAKYLAAGLASIGVGGASLAMAVLATGGDGNSKSSAWPKVAACVFGAFNVLTVCLLLFAM